MAQKLVMKILVKPSSETLGKEFYFPDCPISRALVMCKFVKTIRENPRILPRDVQNFMKEGIDVEYRGRRSETLDQLGATKTDE